MSKPRKCLGWPVGTPCVNHPGTQWSRWWCGPCNQQRLDHINGQLKKIQVAFKCSTEGK